MREPTPTTRSAASQRELSHADNIQRGITARECRVANTSGPCPLRPRAASLTTPVLSLFARVPSLGAPHHSEQARSPEDSFGATTCSFTSKVLVESSLETIAACVNPSRQHEARHRNISEPTPTTRSAASQRGSEPTPTTRSEASGQLLGPWFHDLGPAC